MHNCKRTRDALIELAVGELNEAQSRAIRSELHNCEACRAEQMAIAGTLRVSRQALSADDYAQFRARLEQEFPGERFLIVRFGDHQPMFAKHIIAPTLDSSELGRRIAAFDMAASSALSPVLDIAADPA